MKLVNFVFWVLIFTLFCLLYVYQQTQIFLLAYTVQKKSDIYQELVDKNTLLRYNISRSASLTRIDLCISQNNNFQMPEAYQLVKVETKPTGGQRPIRRETLLSRIFSVRQQAEAKTIKP